MERFMSRSRSSVRNGCAAGFAEAAQAVSRIRKRPEWSAYVAQLLRNAVQPGTPALQLCDGGRLWYDDAGWAGVQRRIGGR